MYPWGPAPSPSQWGELLPQGWAGKQGGRVGVGGSKAGKEPRNKCLRSRQENPRHVKRLVLVFP